MNWDNIEWLRYYVRVVRKESSWGRSQSLHNYRNYIRLESDELRLAVRLEDYVNIREELADVYMMLEFYCQELVDHLRSVSNHKKTVDLKKYAISSNSPKWEGTGKQKMNSLAHLKRELITLASSYSFSETELSETSCIKLVRRYPYLLPYQQMTIDDEYWGEEFQWETQKNYYKMLEFCTCLTEGCENYHKAYNGRNFSVEKSKSGRKSYIVCQSCHSRIPLSKAVLFYGSKQDYKVALRAVVEYMNTQEKERVCEQYGLKPRILTNLIQCCQDNPELFNYIARSRYHLDQINETYRASSFMITPFFADD